ncbi:MAG: RND transporter, partial [Chromatiaceae bacterium]
MLRRIFPLIILALGVSGFLALKATRPKPEPVVPQERVWLVETQTVTPGEHRPELALFARVEAPDRV